VQLSKSDAGQAPGLKILARRRRERAPVVRCWASASRCTLARGGGSHETAVPGSSSAAHGPQNVFVVGVPGRRRQRRRPRQAVQVSRMTNAQQVSHRSKGSLDASWAPQRVRRQTSSPLTVPPNSSATALIPATDVATIRESGKTVAQSGLTATAGPCKTTRIELPPRCLRLRVSKEESSPALKPLTEGGVAS